MTSEHVRSAVFSFPYKFYSIWEQEGLLGGIHDEQSGGVFVKCSSDVILSQFGGAPVKTETVRLHVPPVRLNRNQP